MNVHLDLNRQAGAALLLIGIFCQPTAAVVLFSEDFNELGGSPTVHGTPLSDFGFVDQFGPPVSEVRNTPELGLAFDSRGDNSLHVATIGVPTATGPEPRYEIGLDVLVDGSGTRASSLQVGGNASNPTASLWANIDLNLAGNWNVQLWDNNGNLQINEDLILAPSTGTYNAKLVVDVPSLQMWAEVNGEQSASMSISAGDLLNINSANLVADSRLGRVAAVHDNLLVQTTDRPTPNWQPHFVVHGNTLLPAQKQVLTKPIAPGNEFIVPMGIVQMDNGEVAMTAIVGDANPGFGFSAIAFSKDKGGTWSEFQEIPPYAGILTYHGGGTISTTGGPGMNFSNDYGRTWEPPIEFPTASNGLPWNNEGNAGVDRDANGMATRINDIGYTFDSGGTPVAGPDPFTGHFRFSDDGGLTWQGEVAPPQWKFNESDNNGTFYVRGVSEGSLVRADNGDLIAALRTDMPPVYFDVPNNDSLEGLAVSISSDDGATWSDLNFLYPAGRHHANLQKLPNGDLVMTLIVRDDIRGSRDSLTGTSLDLTTRLRGMDALISHDNGQTWNLDERYILDSFEYLDSSIWFDGKTGHLGATVLDDGTILSAYGNEIIDNGERAIVLVKWDPSVTPIVAEVLTWAGDASGDWDLFSNWTLPLAPNSNVSSAIFGSAITSPATVFTNRAVIVKSVQFDNTNTYAIAGGGSVDLEADTGNATIDVLQGSHQFQVVVNLASNTDVDIASAAVLAFNNALNLNGNDLTKTGLGTMQINNVLNTGGGVVSAVAGIVSGSGMLLGDLDNSTGTLAPGNSPGKFTIEGDYTHGVGATLAIEISGIAQSHEYDLLNVTGRVTLNGGTLELMLLNGFNPSEGDSYDILDFSAIDGIGFDLLDLPALASGLVWDTSDLMTAGSLSVSAIPEPSTAMLMGNAMFTLLGQGRRRCRR